MSGTNEEIGSKVPKIKYFHIYNSWAVVSQDAGSVLHGTFAETKAQAYRWFRMLLRYDTPLFWHRLTDEELRWEEGAKREAMAVLEKRRQELERDFDRRHEAAMAELAHQAQKLDMGYE